MDGQVASVDAQAEGSGVQFPEFDAAARELLRRRNHAAADPLLKGIRGDVPGEQAESDQGEDAEGQKELPQDAPTLGRNRLGGLFGRRNRFGRSEERRVGKECRSRWS